MILCALLAILGTAQANLPPKTYSGVCPAVMFEQGLIKIRNNYYVVNFEPLDHELDFKFVNVHLALETMEGQLVGDVENYPMEKKPFETKWVAEIRSLKHIASLQQRHSNLRLAYSFTYCVGINGSPVDCDTQTFALQRFLWRAGDFPPCSMECGLQTHNGSRSVECDVAGDEDERQSSWWHKRTVVRLEGEDDEAACDPLERPAGEQQCPATEACVTYSTMHALVECPTECGLEASRLIIPATCWGSDGAVYPAEFCPDDAMHEDCPATAPCVVHFWDAEHVTCPIECGLQATILEPLSFCMGTDGRVYPDAQCPETRPAGQLCSATPECVTFLWMALQPQCPAACGLPGTLISPGSLCIGSDGQTYPDGACATAMFPEDVRCPATMACVTYQWITSSKPCPTQCGVTAHEINDPPACLGSDNSVYSGAMCRNKPLPPSTLCAATAPCLVLNWHRTLMDCPSECGILETQRPATLECWGNDGRPYPSNMCSAATLPAPAQCPATQVCVKWIAQPFQCPSHCGLGGKYHSPAAACMGSDGRSYDEMNCDHLPRLAPVFCSATAECVTFTWLTAEVDCPVACGNVATRVIPMAVCMGSDSQTYKDRHCAHLFRPAPVFCTATPKCVTHAWVASLVQCPTVCGQYVQQVIPEASCVGSDARAYGPEACAHLQPPPPVLCPATGSCVQYKWREGLLEECPNECGLEATVITRQASCVGSDGSFPPRDYCEEKRYPKPQFCQATEKCPLSPYCHPIEFDNRVDRFGSNYQILFIPLGKNIRKHNLEWVDVHLSVEDGKGNALLGGELTNYRMSKPGKNDEQFEFTQYITAPRTIALLQQPGRQLVYSFTYCINMIDCDTHKFFYTVPELGPQFF